MTAAAQDAPGMEAVFPLYRCPVCQGEARAFHDKPAYCLHRAMPGDANPLGFRVNMVRDVGYALVSDSSHIKALASTELPKDELDELDERTFQDFLKIIFKMPPRWAFR